MTSAVQNAAIREMIATFRTIDPANQVWLLDWGERLVCAGASNARVALLQEACARLSTQGRAIPVELLDAIQANASAARGGCAH